MNSWTPTGLAAAPTRAAGGVRRQGESPDGFRQRMDDNRVAPGQQPVRTASPPLTRQRHDRILAARADGTFDEKRDAFNKANMGSQHMDEAGTITQTPQNSAAPPQPKGSLISGHSPGTSIWKPAAPPAAGATPPAGSPPMASPPVASPPAGSPPPAAPAGSPPMASPPITMKPIGKINGQPASLVNEQIRNAQVPAPASPPTSPVASPVTSQVTPPASPAPKPYLTEQETNAVAQNKALYMANIGLGLHQMKTAAPPNPRPIAPSPSPIVETPRLQPKMKTVPGTPPPKRPMASMPQMISVR